MPQFRRTLGPEVGELAALAGLPPDPEQQLLLDITFATGANGLSAAFEIADICCRQNMKTGFFKMAELGWLYLTDERLIVHSAHEFRTSQEAFRDTEELIVNSDYLRRRVKAVYRGNGDEAIEMLSGARIIYKTRTKGGGRGLSGSKVVLDEAFALLAMHMGALLPTLSAQPDPQVLYGSSACLAHSKVLRGIVKRGRAGNDPRLGYCEWCAPDPAKACAAGEECTHALDAEGCGCDKPELWQRGNPALGRRITVEYIASERRALPPPEFARERMGWHDEPDDEDDEASPIDADKWQALTELPANGDSPVFAVDVPLDRSRAWIGVATPRPDGRLQLELLDSSPGTGWVVQRARELRANWSSFRLTIARNSPAAALLPDFEAAGIEVDVLSSEDVARACGAMVDAVIDGTIAHLNDPILNTAVAAARRRGESSVFSRSGTGDISPLYAVTFARWLAATTQDWSIFFFNELDDDNDDQDAEEEER